MVVPYGRMLCYVSLTPTLPLPCLTLTLPLPCRCRAAAQVFGTPSELVEMFDMAHVLNFLIVVLFVGMIAVILWRFAYFCREWDDYEVTAMECVKQGELAPPSTHTATPHQSAGF